MSRLEKLKNKKLKKMEKAQQNLLKKERDVVEEPIAWTKILHLQQLNKKIDQTKDGLGDNFEISSDFNNLDLQENNELQNKSPTTHQSSQTSDAQKLENPKNNKQNTQKNDFQNKEINDQNIENLDSLKSENILDKPQNTKSDFLPKQRQEFTNSNIDYEDNWEQDKEEALLEVFKTQNIPISKPIENNVFTPNQEFPSDKKQEVPSDKKQKIQSDKKNIKNQNKNIGKNMQQNNFNQDFTNNKAPDLQNTNSHPNYSLNQNQNQNPQMKHPNINQNPNYYNHQQNHEPINHQQKNNFQHFAQPSNNLSNSQTNSPYFNSNIQRTQNIPLNMQNTQNIPLNMQNTQSMPLNMQNTQNMPLNMQNTQSMPLNMRSTQNIPLNTQNNQRSPFETRPNQNAYQSMPPNQHFMQNGFSPSNTPFQPEKTQNIPLNNWHRQSNSFNAEQTQNIPLNNYSQAQNSTFLPNNDPRLNQNFQGNFQPHQYPQNNSFRIPNSQANQFGNTQEMPLPSQQQKLNPWKNNLNPSMSKLQNSYEPSPQKSLILEVENLFVNVNQKTILQNVNLQLIENSFHLLVGLNGSGKSILCKTIAGLYPSFNGRIIWRSGQNSQIQNRPFYLFNNNFYISSDLTVNEYLYQKINQQSQITNVNFDIDKLLRDLKLDEQKNQYINFLSACENKKLQIIDAIICNYKIWIFDDFLVGLDPMETKLFLNFFSNQKPNRITILFAATELNKFIGHVDIVSFLSNKTIVYTTSIIDPSDLEQKYLSLF